MKEEIKAVMDKEVYLSLPRDIQKEIDISSIDVPDFDYSEDEAWQALKKESMKAYKKLKAREFELRNK